MTIATQLINLLEAEYPSRYAIGDPVLVVTDSGVVKGHIRTVTFTSMKVRYSVYITVDGATTTLHNIDSAIVDPDPNGIKIAVADDNYS